MRKRSKNAVDNQSSDNGIGASSLLRGLDILRAFRPTDSTLGNQDLIDRTGFPKATVSRLTYALASQGYLIYHEDMGRYSIGPATVSLGYSGLSSVPVVRIVQPLLRLLSDRTGVAAALGARSGLEMIYLANCRAYGPVTLQLNVGSHVPIWRTAMGLAYMVEMQSEAREALVKKIRLAEPQNANALQHNLEEAEESYRTRGYVCSFGAWYSYINAVGVAFRPTDGSQLVALTCGGIADLATREACLGEIGSALLDTIGRMRQMLEDPRSSDYSVFLNG